MSRKQAEGPWVLVLGASSGFGEACARAFAEAGYPIFGVHLDRRSGLAKVGKLKDELEETGVDAHFFNMNAADPEKMESALDEMESRMEPGQEVGVLMHSLAPYAHAWERTR